MNEKELQNQIEDALNKVINQRKNNPSGAYWAILYVSLKDNFYIQFVANVDNEIELEVSGSHYDLKRLSDNQLKIIESYGYKYPSKSNPNFFKFIDLLNTSVESIRDEIFYILVNVLDLKNNLPLKIEFGEDEKYGKDTALGRFFRKIKRRKLI